MCTFRFDSLVWFGLASKDDDEMHQSAFGPPIFFHSSIYFFYLS